MRRVLVCDSDGEFRCNVRSVLENKGFSVQEANRPGEAMKYVLNERCCGVIFNLHTEDLDGVQILSAIKKVNNGLPVIVVTDKNVPLYSVSSIIHESFRLFQKPVDCNEIALAIGEAIKVYAQSNGK